MVGCDESASNGNGNGNGYDNGHTPIEMVRVEGGTFELGRELGGHASGDTTPVSTVTLTGFYMGKFLVTQGEWYDVMGNRPSFFTGTNIWGGGTAPETFDRRDLPVERVSWYDAIVFANRLSELRGLTPAYEMQTAANTSEWSTDPATWGALPMSNNARWNNVRVITGSTGYRLPTEAQWEFAAKGGNEGETYTFSGSNDADEVAWHNGNSGGRTRPVGTLAPNGLGIYDMSGNVWEWVWDWWGSYTSEAKTDPTGASSGTDRVLRSGCWNVAGVNSRSVNRQTALPDNRFTYIGFRLVRP